MSDKVTDRDSEPVEPHTFMILAEHATIHRDGTLTLVRSGIGEAVNKAVPAPFEGQVVAWHRLDENLLRGTISITITSPGGAELHKAEYPFEVTAGFRTACVVAKMPNTLPEFGKYKVVLRVDGQEKASVELLLRQPDPGAK